MGKPKKKFIDETMSGFFDNGYYAEPAKNQTPPSTRYLQDLYGRMLQTQENKSSTFPLTHKDIMNGGVNSVYVAGEGRGFDFVPTYNGNVVLPEITVTPEGNGFYNPVHNQYWRKRKHLGGMCPIR